MLIICREWFENRLVDYRFRLVGKISIVKFSKEDMAEFSELSSNLLERGVIEHLSSALSVYDTTLDVNSTLKPMSLNRKKRFGQHYTPWDVAKLMCKKIKNSDKMDRSCSRNRDVSACIYDINSKNTRIKLLLLHYDRLAVMATRLAIWSIGNFDSKLEELLVKQIVHSDFLVEDSDNLWTGFGVNSIIINPPYVTHKVGNVNFKNFECKSCGNLWTLFVERSLRIISNPQILKWLQLSQQQSQLQKGASRLEILETCQNLSMMHIDVVPYCLSKAEKSISSANNTRAISLS